MQDLQIKTPPAELPIYLVADGIISNSSLNEINKSKKWLYTKLKINNKSDLKNILIASYDNKKDIVSITKKIN